MNVAGIAVRWGDVASFDGRRESFARGAFLDCLDRVRRGEHVVELREDHGARVIASTADGSLTVVESEIGLIFDGRLDGAAGREAALLVWDDFYRGASIAFSDYTCRDAGERRLVTSATLLEISLVDRPAYKRGGIFIHADGTKVVTLPCSPAPTPRKREPMYEHNEPVWEPRSFPHESCNEVMLRLRQERRAAPETVTVLVEADDGRETRIHSPRGDNGAFRRRVEAHREAIERRAATCGGFERQCYPVKLSVE